MLNNNTFLKEQNKNSHEQLKTALKKHKNAISQRTFHQIGEIQKFFSRNPNNSGAAFRE